MARDETLGQRIKRLREAAGLTQALLAEKGQFSLFNLQNWEQNHRVPSLAAAFKLAKALGVRLEVIGELAREEGGRLSSKKVERRRGRPPRHDSC
jgi:transcriptional regulator with XRE-family HTH domain